MLKYDFNIPKYTKEKLFFSIREKKDVILLLIETIKFIKASPCISENTDAKIIITISKMSRIFYILNNKYFSIIFPFRIEVNEKEYRFFLKDGTELTYEFLSKITELIKNEAFFKTFEDFIDEIVDKNNILPNLEEKIWDFIKEICFLEYGYLRYDYDQEHENGNFHPLNHLDINYSNRTTFKLGLSREITTQEFIEILDNTLERKFIKL